MRWCLFAVNSDRLFTVSENDLKTVYGCKSVHLISYVRGIGDVDEVLKPLPGAHANKRCRIQKRS